MGVESVRSPVGLCKIAIIVLGIVVMGIGLHSHFQSDWKKYKLYKLCDLDFEGLEIKDCPKISMEQYYVAMVIIFFMLSIVSFAATLVADMNERMFKLVDLGYHGAGAFFLFIGAIVYMVSANQIGGDEDSGLKLLKGEKIAAGVFSLFQTALYAFTAFLIARG